MPTAWSERKLDLLRARVAEFESQWRGTAAEDKVHYGLVLRDLYWEWLAAARNHYASSSPYQDVWRHVERGFAELAGVKHSPSR